MSLGIFGLALLGGLVGLCWRAKGRLIATAVMAVLLGIVVAGSDGPLADAAGELVDALRDLLDGIWDLVESLGGELFGEGTR